MKKVYLSIVLGLLLIGMTNAAVVVYSDFAAWQLAVGTYSLEDFNDATLNPDFTIYSDHGYNLNQSGYVGKMWDRVSAEPPYWKTTIDFVPPIMAFGGVFDLVGPGGPGEGIDLDIVLLNNGTVVDIAKLPSSQNGFLGFTCSEDFTDVLIKSADLPGAWCETYTLDNMVYATPEPSSIALLALGFFSLLLARRKKIMK